MKIVFIVFRHHAEPYSVGTRIDLNLNNRTRNINARRPTFCDDDVLSSGRSGPRKGAAKINRRKVCETAATTTYTCARYREVRSVRTINNNNVAAERKRTSRKRFRFRDAFRYDRLARMFRETDSRVNSIITFRCAAVLRWPTTFCKTFPFQAFFDDRPYDRTSVRPVRVTTILLRLRGRGEAIDNYCNTIIRLFVASFECFRK